MTSQPAMVAFPNNTSLVVCRLSRKRYEHLLQRRVTHSVVLHESVRLLQMLHYAKQLRQQNARVTNVVVQKAL